MQKNKHLILTLAITLLLSVTSALAQAIIGGVDLTKNPNLIFTAPKSADPKSEVIISRAEYVISYNRKFREMNWASWVVSPDSIGHSGRSGKFMADDELENYLRQYNEHVVGPNDYKGSCFDRGHQVPSGDRTSSEAVNKRVFYMSNMIPQTAHLNKGAAPDPTQKHNFPELGDFTISRLFFDFQVIKNEKGQCMGFAYGDEKDGPCKKAGVDFLVGSPVSGY